MDYQDRRERLRQRLAAHGLDAVALSYGANLAYYTGWEPHPGERPLLLVVAAAGDALVVPRLHADDAERLDVATWRWYGDGAAPVGVLREVQAAALGDVGRLGVENGMRLDFVRHLEEAFASGPAALADAVLDEVRLRKGAPELERLRAVARLTDTALERVFADLRPGVSEREAAGEVRRALAAAGADDTAFAIVGFGPNSAEAHRAPDDRRLAPGDAVLLDIGARKDGYVSDITRVGFVGTAPEGYGEVFDLVRAALDAALAATRAGVPAGSVDRAARLVIERGGHGPLFRHRVGHGIGVSVHEAPYLTGENRQPLEEGMVVTLEPGVYFLGRFGIRLEQAVVVTSDGCELLSASPLEARRIPPA